MMFGRWKRKTIIAPAVVSRHMGSSRQQLWGVLPAVLGYPPVIQQWWFPAILVHSAS